MPSACPVSNKKNMERWWLPKQFYISEKAIIQPESVARHDEPRSYGHPVANTPTKRTSCTHMCTSSVLEPLARPGSIPEASGSSHTHKRTTCKHMCTSSVLEPSVPPGSIPEAFLHLQELLPDLRLIVITKGLIDHLRLSTLQRQKGTRNNTDYCSTDMILKSYCQPLHNYQSSGAMKTMGPTKSTVFLLGTVR